MMMFKRLLNSMTCRVFLILLGGTIASASLTMVLAANERKDILAQVRTRHVVERVEQIVQMLEAMPPESRGKMAAITAKAGIRIDFSDSMSLTGNVANEELTSAIVRTMGGDRKIVAFERYDRDCPVHPVALSRTGGTGPHYCRTVLATLLDGTSLRIDIASPGDRMPPFFPPNLLPYWLLFLLCVSALALLVAYIATKPLRRLAQAASDLGHDLEQPRLPENKGPTEVREAAGAFNSMQSQIRHFIQERTYMLTAIAHDLQTPLTRLRLRLEKVSDEELRDKLVADLSVTQDMVKEGLELVRSLNAEEPFELLDLDSLIITVCNDTADAGFKVTRSGKVDAPVMARPGAMRRCLSNLVDNAVKYGEFARVAVSKEGSKVIISVVDGGPGIPEDQLEKVFQPFNRLDDSRSRQTGGTGLGLTIARNIAEKHRGTLKLRNIRSGELGLEAVLELPIG